MADSEELVLRNSRVTADAWGNICLNDLWELAGRPENKRPRDWYRGKRVKALEGALQDRIVEILHKSPKDVEGSTYKVAGRGTSARTYAHPVLALDYSEYLEPSLGVEVRDVFLRYRANDVSLANDILDRIAEQIREDEMRVHIRGEISERNRELASEGGRRDAKGGNTQNCTMPAIEGFTTVSTRTVSIG